MEVTGLSEAIEALDGLRDSANGAMTEALLAGAEIIRASAEEKAPRLTGFLGNHIITAENPDSPLSVYIGPTKNAFWGDFVERGFTHVGGVAIPARPFMRPAYDEKQDEALAVAGAKLTELLIGGLT